MDCNTAHSLFADAIEDQLDQAQLAALQSHLAGCDECRDELTHARATLQLVRGHLAEHAPSEETDRLVMARASQALKANKEPGFWEKFLQSLSILVSRPALGLGAVAILLVLLTTSQMHFGLIAPKQERAQRSAKKNEMMDVAPLAKRSLQQQQPKKSSSLQQATGKKKENAQSTGASIPKDVAAPQVAIPARRRPRARRKPRPTYSKRRRARGYRLRKSRRRRGGNRGSRLRRRIRRYRPKSPAARPRPRRRRSPSLNAPSQQRLGFGKTMPQRGGGVLERKKKAGKAKQPKRLSYRQLLRAATRALRQGNDRQAVRFFRVYWRRTPKAQQRRAAKVIRERLSRAQKLSLLPRIIQ